MADNDSGWSQRETGTTEDNKVVTFKTGEGDNEGQTLVGGGEQSSRQFDRAHDHYGPDTSQNTDYGNLDNAPDANDYTDPGYEPRSNEK